MKLHKGIGYFQEYTWAQTKQDELKGIWPDVRIVSYQRGYAVQYYISGPYYPQCEI